MGDLVKIGSNNFRGFELGIVHRACRYDEGIIVQIADESTEGVTRYECINPNRPGDSIVTITARRRET